MPSDSVSDSEDELKDGHIDMFLHSWQKESLQRLGMDGT